MTRRTFVLLFCRTVGVLGMVWAILSLERATAFAPEFRRGIFLPSSAALVLAIIFSVLVGSMVIGVRAGHLAMKFRADERPDRIRTTFWIAGAFGVYCADRFGWFAASNAISLASVGRGRDASTIWLISLYTREQQSALLGCIVSVLLAAV